MDGQGYRTLLKVCEAFKGKSMYVYWYGLMCLLVVADVVLVLDNERLLFQLKQDLPSEANILPLPKSAGVSDISKHISLLPTEFFYYTFCIGCSEEQICTSFK